MLTWPIVTKGECTCIYFWNIAQNVVKISIWQRRMFNRRNIKKYFVFNFIFYLKIVPRGNPVFCAIFFWTHCNFHSKYSLISVIILLRRTKYSQTLTNVQLLISFYLFFLLPFWGKHTGLTVLENFTDLRSFNKATSWLYEFMSKFLWRIIALTALIMAFPSVFTCWS